MKKVILMMVVALCVATASAQLNVGANVGTQILTGDGSMTGFGLGIGGEYLVMPNLGVGVNLGYYIMDREKWDDETITYFLLPVYLTGKYYFLTENFRPYGGVDLGLYKMGARAKYNGISESNSDTKVGIGPVVGFQYDLSDNLALDINAKYYHVFDTGEFSTNFVGINLGIVYKFEIGR